MQTSQEDHNAIITQVYHKTHEDFKVKFQEIMGSAYLLSL